MPSIFEDNELIKKLIEAELNQIKRLAQAVPTPNIAPLSAADSGWDLRTYQLAKKMALQLQRKIDPQKAKEAKDKFNPISAADKTTLDPTFKEVKSLGDFLNWIKLKQINFDGKKIVYSEDEAKGKTDLYQFNAPDLDIHTINIDKKYEKEGNPVRNKATGETFTKGLFVDKNALVGLISYLINNYSETPLGIPLRKLVDELNEKLPEGEKVSKEPKKEETPTSTLDPNVPIDTFSNNIIVKNPLALTDPQDAPFFRGADKSTQLFLYNISDTEKFKLWLQNKRIDRGGQLFPAADNMCETVNLLYLRSQALSTYATALVKNYGEYVKKYQEAVMALGKQFNCAITSPGSAEPGKGGTGAAGQTGKQNEQAIKTILSMALDASILPLSLENINFPRIESFLTVVAQLNDDEINPVIDEIKAYIADIGRDATSKIFQLPYRGGDIDAFRTDFKPRSQMKQNYIQHLGTLNIIVQRVRYIINLIRQRYGNAITTEDQQQNIAGQIDHIAPQNANNLRSLTSADSQSK